MNAKTKNEYYTQAKTLLKVVQNHENTPYQLVQNTEAMRNLLLTIGNMSEELVSSETPIKVTFGICHIISQADYFANNDSGDDYIFKADDLFINFIHVQSIEVRRTIVIEELIEFIELFK